MITKLSHATIWVTNQEEARRFYTEKLGFTVRVDQTMDNGFRWLTVAPPEQPDFQLILMEPKAGPFMDEEAATQIRALVEQGKLGPGVFFTPNCRETYEQLKARGVEFMTPPEDKFYGTEAMMKDNSGNWFSMSTPSPQYGSPNSSKTS